METLRRGYDKNWSTDGPRSSARARARLRRRDEEHRASTPLELFFDLCFVVAVAQAGALLVEAIVEGHPAHALSGYLFTFFGIWWAWVNFTWFASAYDSDDVLYRIATLVQIAGVLVYAAGIPSAFHDGDFRISVAGYVLMRLALTFQWLRAAAGETGPARRVALRYAGGLLLIQTGWVAMLALPVGYERWLFLVLALAEVSLPAFAERPQQTNWHPSHVAERYGLFTLITLGETVAAATVAVQSALDRSAELVVLLPIAAGGLLVVFSAYWIYFSVPIEGYLASNRQAFAWGYGHLVIFGAAAAIGAGIEVVVEEATGEAHLSEWGAAAAVTLPTALFLFAVWVFHARFTKRGLARQLVLPATAVLVLAATFAGHWAVPVAGLISAGAVAAGLVLARRVWAGGAGERGPGRRLDSQL